ncbi:MAG TPA: hypothetical protein VKA18_14560 [Alphaproteobacteria bacterium]|nr:hypothetical protein [Alphaproteobacteria bacterium]
MKCEDVNPHQIGRLLCRPRLNFLADQVAGKDSWISRRQAGVGAAGHAGNLGVVVPMQEKADALPLLAPAASGRGIDEAVAVGEPRIVRSTLHHVSEFDNETLTMNGPLIGCTLKLLD